MSKSAAPHLIGIGRLGGTDEEGWHHVMVKPSFKDEFDLTDDLYLIFNSDRVFYVTICDRKTSDKKMWVKFREDGIAAERKKHKEVILALEDSDADAEESPDLLGRDAVYNGVLLGNVVDVFYNGAQDVLVIATPFEEDILIPVVDYFLPEYGEDMDALVFENLDELLAASGFFIAAGALEYQEE